MLAMISGTSAREPTENSFRGTKQLSCYIANVLTCFVSFGQRKVKV